MLDDYHENADITCVGSKIICRIYRYYLKWDENVSSRISLTEIFALILVMSFVVNKFIPRSNFRSPASIDCGSSYSCKYIIPKFEHLHAD